MKVQATRRFSELAAFLLPVIAGILFMALMGAPFAWLVTNVGAAICVVIAWFVFKDRSMPPLALAIAALALLGASFVGPAVDGVHRWIALGPLRLHAGMLALPLLGILLLQLNKQIAAAIAAVAALIFALQPDRASALALLCIVLIWTMLARNLWALFALATAVCSFSATMANADALSPVPFVENVLRDAVMWHPLVAVGMSGALVAAGITPILLGRHTHLMPSAIWSAGLVGYSAASLLGAYPTPLLGYGVSPILGFGLALTLLATENRKAI